MRTPQRGRFRAVQLIWTAAAGIAAAAVQINCTARNRPRCGVRINPPAPNRRSGVVGRAQVL